MRLRLSEKINLVLQGNMGCFVACVAMVAGITYDQAMELVHPARTKKIQQFSLSRRGFIPFSNYEINASLDPRLAFLKLQKLGLKPKLVKNRNIYNLNKTAILWVRWEEMPHLMHSVVYDAKNKLFLDPMLNYPLSDLGKEKLQRLLDSVIYLG